MLNVLRMAGQKVRAFDDAYAAKIADYINGFKTKEPSMAQNVKAAAGFSAGVPATRKFDVEDDSAVLRNLMGYGVPALNAGVRYGLPALGAVGIAEATGSLYDLAAQTPVFGNNPADVQDPNLLVTYVS